MLAAVRQISWLDPSQPLPTATHITYIRYILSSFPKRMRYPPQYQDIHFMTSGPLHPVHNIPSASSPLENNNTYPLTIPPLTLQDPLYSHIFQYDEDILEELTTPHFPWNALYHRACFLSQEAFHCPIQTSICTIETKDFIPSGNIDLFNNPIPTPYAFEEDNMDNISPTIKIDISITPRII